MTFSDKGIQKVLASHFVLGWENTKDDASAGASFAHSPKDPSPSCVKGNGEHNIQILICTPDGKMLDVIAGYVSPEEFRLELEWALALGRSLAKAQNGETAVREAHEAAVNKIDAVKDDGQDPFAKFGRMLDRRAHEWLAAHPLHPAIEFDPVAIVGEGQSFFGASKGATPKDKLGGVPNVPKGSGK